MANPNLAKLQEALKIKPAPAAIAVPRGDLAEAGGGSSYMAPSRIGKTNITAYLSADYKSNLRLIQAKTGRSLQALVAEALNDLFAKHDVPTIHGE